MVLLKTRGAAERHSDEGAARPCVASLMGASLVCGLVCAMSGGFLVGNDDVVWPIRTFAYILPLKYCIKSMVYSEYIDADDYTPCDTSDPDEICFGNTGKEVLATLGKLYHLFDDESTFAQDFGFILAICAAIKTMYFVGLVMESRKVSTIKSA